MDKAIALGFWAKHPLVMDALNSVEDFESGLDSVDGLPTELVILAKNNRELLSKVMEAAHENINEFEELYERLRTTLEKGAKISRKQDWDWDHSVTAKTLDGRKTRAKPVEFGWHWRTERNLASPPKDVMFIQTWIWRKGGRASEECLVRQLRKWAPALGGLTAAGELREGVLQSGTVRLDWINVSERVKDDFSLDLDALRKDVWKSFAWITNARLSKLFYL